MLTNADKCISIWSRTNALDKLEWELTRARDAQDQVHAYIDKHRDAFSSLGRAEALISARLAQLVETDLADPPRTSARSAHRQTTRWALRIGVKQPSTSSATAPTIASPTNIERSAPNPRASHAFSGASTLGISKRSQDERAIPHPRSTSVPNSRDCAPTPLVSPIITPGFILI